MIDGFIVGWLVTVSIILIIIAWLCLASAKIEVTSKQLQKIIDAIHEYKCDCIGRHDWEAFVLVNYSDMRSYEETFNRWFDWGYKNILPPDKFELIKPFIK